MIVTGGSGFLGSHIVEVLRRENCSRIFVVRSSEHDLTRQECVEKLFKEHESDIVTGGIKLLNKSGFKEVFFSNQTWEKHRPEMKSTPTSVLACGWSEIE